jgi:hypothetical protein
MYSELLTALAYKQYIYIYIYQDNEEINLSLCFIKYHSIKTCGEVEVALQVFILYGLPREPFNKRL